MATKSAFSNYPIEAFPIGTGLGNKSTGGAVIFQMNGDCGLAGVSLLLKDYTGANDQKIKVELWDNLSIPGRNKPGKQLGSFDVPAANNGTVAEFMCALPTTVNLVGGHIYWLFAYGVLTETAMQKGVKASWLAGGVALGNAALVESQGYINGNFVPGNIIPAFSLLVAG
jgi:hypothetical protein